MVTGNPPRAETGQVAGSVYEPIHQPCGWSPFPFPRDWAVPLRHSRRREGQILVSPWKGERDRLRVGGSHASLPFQDGVTRTVDVRTHHQPFGWSPALEKGGYDGGMVVIRTVPLPFSPGLGCSFSSQPSQGRTIALCPPGRGKGPLAGRGFACLSTFSRRCYSGATRRVGVRTYPPLR